MPQEHNTALPLPTIERINLELKRRTLAVKKIEDITPLMRRIYFTGDDLIGFVSHGPADHIKLFFGDPQQNQQGRYYTPRFYDKKNNELAIDFVLHDSGIASNFAYNAKQGDTLIMGGPRGSMIIGGDINAWLLIGDETALPAIGRRIEEAQMGTKITVIAAVANANEVQTFTTKANVTYHWVYRPVEQADDPSYMLNQAEKLILQDKTFIWIAGETKVARTLRMFFNTERHVPLPWIKAAGYWVKGVADSNESFE